MATRKYRPPESCSPSGLLIPKVTGAATFGTLRYPRVPPGDQPLTKRLRSHLKELPTLNGNNNLLDEPSNLLDVWRRLGDLSRPPRVPWSISARLITLRVSLESFKMDEANSQHKHLGTVCGLTHQRIFQIHLFNQVLQKYLMSGAHHPERSTSIQCR